MYHFFEYLKSRSAKIVRVKLLRNVNAKAVDESTATGRTAGTVLDVDEQGASALEGSVEYLGEVGPDGNLIKPTVRAAKPARYVRKQRPARFSELPACFGVFWDLREELAELEFNARAAEAELGDSRYSGAAEGDGSPAGAAIEKFVRARDAVLAFDHGRLGRALLACSDAAVSEIRSVEGTRSALENVAFETFCVRVAPLELAEPHARRLFQHTAGFRAYVFPVVVEADMRHAGGGRAYMDRPIEEIAQRRFAARARRAKFVPLLEKAKAELEATRAALMPTEKPRIKIAA